jgi:hypothetical protein
MRYNMFNRFEVLRYPDPEGLSARLAAFTSSGEATGPPHPGIAVTQPPKPDMSGNETIPPVKENTPPDKEKEVVSKENEEEEEEEKEFPVIGKGKAAAAEDKPKEFDEAAFDALTEEEAKDLEEKAAKKFKDLKAELKVFKKREFKPDLESIPEYKSIKEENASLKAAKEENESLRKRLEDVMKTSDEIAVKESPDFISRVRKPIADMKGAIQVLAESVNMDPIDLMAIIAEKDPAKQDKALEVMESKVPRRTLSRIEMFCDDYLKIEQAEQELLADIPKTLAASRKQQKEQEEANRKLMTGQFHEAARTSFKEYGHTVPGWTDSSGALTDLAESVIKDVKTNIDPHALEPDDLGFMIFASKALPAATKEIKRLRKALKAAGKEDSITIPGTPPAPVKKPDPDVIKPGTTLAERMKGMRFTFDPSRVG